MKKETGNKIRLGMFVTAAIVFFVLGIYYIGQKQKLFSATFRVKAIYKDVGGLQVGNNVRFDGINVGTVEAIKIISDTAVQVDVIIEKSVKKFIKSDATESVGSEGLMGDKLVNISPGSSTAEIENDAFIQVSGGNSMDELMGQVKIVAGNAAQISSDLADIVGNIHEGNGAIGKLFMDSTFAKNLDQTLVNVKQGAGGFRDNMEAAKHNILLRGYFKKKENEEKEPQKK